MILQFVHLYAWALICGALAASSLALLGCHLAARDRALQSICIGQGASVGVLAGSAMFTFLGGSSTLEEWFHVGFAFLFAGLVYLASERLTKAHIASKNSVFITFFILLMSAGHWVVSYYPNLEGHVAQSFFGDIVTIAGMQLWTCLVAAIFALGILTMRWREFSNQSFVLAIFGTDGPSLRPALFNALSFSLITICIHSLGLLFTVSCLFVPTVILSHYRSGGIRFHLIACAVLAGLSTSLGFLATLVLDRFPTVPTISLLLALLCLLVVSSHLRSYRSS